jgi:ABC-type transporter Mla MlaB component
MTDLNNSFSFGEMMDSPSLTIKGPFDFMDAKIDLWIDDQVGKGNASIVLNLSRTHYITAIGIAALFKCIKKIHGAGGLIHIVGATEDMVELIRLGKMDQYVSYIVTG